MEGKEKNMISEPYKNTSGKNNEAPKGDRNI